MGDFDFKGINHLALMSADMDRTVDFYSNTLGMKLTKTIDMASGGKHYFFDCGNGDAVAFFWFPNGEPAVDGKRLRAMAATPGMMNHVAFNVDDSHLERCRELLVERGIEVTEIVNHDDTARGASPEVNATTFVRSIYFRDPDGFQLEIASWCRELTAKDVAPARMD